MKRIPVIAGKCLPPRLPFISTAVTWLLMDRFAAGGLVRGIVYTLLVLLWLIAIWAVFGSSRPVDVLAKERAE